MRFRPSACITVGVSLVILIAKLWIIASLIFACGFSVVMNLTRPEGN